MEDDPSFNAGRGSAITQTGHVENDASIMEGDAMNAGAVGVLSGVRHPSEAARKVMEATPHVLMAGQGATDFALAAGLDTIDEVMDFEYYPGTTRVIV